MSVFTVRSAQSNDITLIKKIADANRLALGFLPLVKVSDAVEQQRVLVLQSPHQLAGFVIFRHRKIDQQTTLSDICVANEWRGQAGGKLLMQALYRQCMELDREFILLKCPVDLAANSFYERVGFRHTATEAGRRRPLNVWQLDINGKEV